MGKKIFVVGAPRSGTTYLARALGLGEDIAYFEESGAYSLYGARRFAAWQSRIQKEAEVFDYHPLRQKLYTVLDEFRGKDRLGYMVARMLLHTKLGTYDLKPSNPLVQIQDCRLDERDLEKHIELVEKYTRLSKEKDGTAFYQAFFRDFVDLSRKRHLLEKTPGHLNFVPVIMASFPDAGIVLISRDKKDAMASFLSNYQAPRRFMDAFTSSFSELKRQCRLYAYYERVEKWISSYSWCRTVDYRELVDNPLETVEAILKWAEIDFNVQKYLPLFIARKADSKWDRLTPEQKCLVERYL